MVANSEWVKESQANPGTKLIYRLMKCEGCKELVFLLLGETKTFHDVLINAMTIPYPIGEIKAQSHWPKPVGKHYVDARKSCKATVYNMVPVAAANCINSVCVDKAAAGKDLEAKIKDLQTKGIVPETFITWLHTTRLLRNIGGHKEESEADISQGEAGEIITFLDVLLEVVYDVPERLKSIRTNVTVKAEAKTANPGAKN